MIINSMIQNYLAEPLVKNYTAPKYPLFIALQNALNSFSNKKSLRDPRADIASVHLSSISLSTRSDLRERSLSSPGSWSLWKCPTSSRRQTRLKKLLSWLRSLKNIQPLNLFLLTSQRSLPKCLNQGI